MANTWQPLPAMPLAVSQAGAGITGGVFYVVAGYTTAYSARAFAYDIAVASWSEIAPVPQGGANGAAVVGADQKLYFVTGPRGSASAYLQRYEPASDSWVTLTGPTAVNGTCLAALPDGRLLHIAGSGSGGLTAETRVYDPTADSWGYLASYPVPTSNLAAATGKDGRVYCFGGTGGDTRTDIFDPAANKWSKGAPIPAAHRSGHRAVRVPDGRIYLIGNSPATASVYVYYPETNNWASAPNMGAARAAASCAADDVGTLYVAGGGDSSSNALASAESLVVNAAPNAPAWVTPNNSSVAVGQNNILDWDFSDPDPGDAQSAYNLKRWELDANDNRIGAAVTTYSTTPLTQHTITAGTLTAGTRYEFQVDTLDSKGVEGPYSVSLFLNAETAPTAATWVDPTSGQAIGTSSYTGVISTASLSESEWTLYADNGGAIDTATVLQGPVSVATGDLRSFTFSGLVNNTAVWWSVRIKDNGLWSQPTQIRTLISYTPPTVPTLNLSADSTSGSLLVSIGNPAPGAGEPDTSYNDVYVDDGDGEQRVATFLPTNQPWRYWTPRAGVDYSGLVRVVAVGSNGTTASS